MSKNKQQPQPEPDKLPVLKEPKKPLPENIKKAFADKKKALDNNSIVTK